MILYHRDKHIMSSNGVQ